MDNPEFMPDMAFEDTSVTDKDIQTNINHYYHDPGEIELRLLALEHEPDLDSWLHVQGAALTVSGTILGLISSKKWFALPLAVSFITIMRAIKPGINNAAIHRFTGLRSREEIDKEKYALKALRGDFKYLLDVPNAVWTAVNK